MIMYSVFTRTFWKTPLLITAALAAVTVYSPSFAMDHLSGKYAMDPTHTSVIFKVDHLGFSTYIGRFDTISGTLDFDEKDPTKSAVNVAIESASINTNSDKLEEELRGAEMFNSEVHPQVTFVSIEIEKTGETTGKITGDLTIAGTTKPVVLDTTFNNGAPHPFPPNKLVLGFSATAAIKRSEFGLNSWLPAIGDDVSLIIETEFQKAD